MEQFFSCEKAVNYDIAARVTKLQKNFRELNDELKRLVHSKLPDLLVMSRIMSTFPNDYFEFKGVWESVPLVERTINKLIERLRLIEMRLPEKPGNESAAFVVRQNGKRKNVNEKKKHE